MKNLFNLLTGLFILLITSCNSKQTKLENKDSSINSLDALTGTVKHADSNYIMIDSQRISKDTYDYVLIYYNGSQKREVYRLRNQDYSVEFKKKYAYIPTDYICYEVADLPTGLTWDILFDNKSKSFFITEHYDVHAVGDTLDRATVNFDKRIASVVSGDKGNRYSIKLNKLWPK
ncbi:MAG: hypothetical protein M0Q26_10000 [Chitinophagaceae bacterium]|nr:hypothetical protein [Chitinophagaceae bacterium]